MKRLYAVLAVVFVALGCSGGAPPVPTLPPLPGGIPTIPPIPLQSLGIPNLFGSPAPGATAAPTSERIQIVNMYVPGDEAPFGIDVYLLRSSPFGGFAAGDPAAGDTPIAHADFGAATGPFDPGSLDGQTAWAAYRAGKPPTHDNLVWNFAGSVVDNGRITVVMSSGLTSGDPSASVHHYGVQVGDRDDSNPASASDFTLAPTTGTLVVDSEGLDAVWGSGSSKALFVKVGDKCGDYFPTSPGQPQPALPGSPTIYYNLPNGSVPVIAYAHDYSAAPDCSGSPQTDPISANIPVGGYEYVFVYSTNGTDLKGFALAPIH